MTVKNEKTKNRSEQNSNVWTNFTSLLPQFRWYKPFYPDIPLSPTLGLKH